MTTRTYTALVEDLRDETASTVEHIAYDYGWTIAEEARRLGAAFDGERVVIRIEDGDITVEALTPNESQPGQDLNPAPET